MEIKQQFLTENDCYKAGRYITPSGIMVHSTGANNPMLRRYLQGDEDIGYNTNGNHWNQGGLDVCVHGFIGLDKSGEVRTYQTLPWNMRAWHCGNSGNNTHISFEICEDDLSDSTYFWQVYNATVELCAHLCREYDISPNDIICHSEGHEQGIASNHADVMHWFPRFGASMDTLRADVARTLMSVPNELEGIMTLPSDWAKEACEWAAEKGYIKGDENGDMKWQDSLTREQFVVILKRVMGE